jgi:arylsulfatase A-like enzyme
MLAGAGIAPGAVARDPRLIDVAPTVAALLGVPAPGHAEARALVELPRLDAAAAARRAAADDARGRGDHARLDRAAHRCVYAPRGSSPVGLVIVNPDPTRLVHIRQLHTSVAALCTDRL